MPRAGHAAPYLVLAIALVAVSFASIFARLADAAPLAIAAWRMGITAVVVVPLSLTGRSGTERPDLRYVVLAAAAGMMLALHFAT